jgi:peptidoglycan/LPS O-acetylase OafA/YrhL
MATPLAPASFRLGYRPALDGVRGISILAVMFVHGGLFWIGRGGFLGVDIFFVLSGFLITTLLVEEWQRAGAISLRNFYARRALRLLPALFAVVIACLAAGALFPPPEGAWAASRQVLVALYLSDWLKVYPPLFHTWSLSIEEQFYVAWPLLLFLMLRLRLRRRTMLATTAALVALVALHRALLWHALAGEARNTIYTRFDARADALLVGCVLGLLLTSGATAFGSRSPRLLRALACVSAACVALLLVVIPSDSPLLYYGGFTAVAAMVAVFILHLFVAPLKFFTMLLELPVLRWFGRLSYGLYLWHLPVYSLYDATVAPPAVRSYTLRLLLPFAIKFLLSVGVAALSFRFIEQPALRLKRRYASARAGDAGARGAGETTSAAKTTTPTETAKVTDTARVAETARVDESNEEYSPA